MKGLMLVLASMTLIGAAPEPGLHPMEYLEHGLEAYEKGDRAGFLENMIAAHRLAPDHPGVLYNLASAQALAGNQQEALKLLNRAVTIGGVDTLGVADDKDFASLKGSPGFDQLLKRIESLRAPIANSTIAYVIPEKALVPEGTTYDPQTRNLYVGSINKRKIVEIAPNGEIRDFLPSKQDGIWAVIGIKVDAKRRHLWAASAGLNSPIVMIDWAKEDEWQTGVFKYDLESGKLLKKYALPVEGKPQFLNDLAISASGDVYVTDTQAHAVYKISHETDAIELLVRPDPNRRRGYNGIAITPDDRHLFLAHATGIDLMDLKTGTTAALAYPDGMSLGGVDGLLFHKGSLIAHQGTPLGSINRYYLSPDLNSVVSREIIDANRPEFNSPTTGAIAGNDYYYIANAQFRCIENGKRCPDEKFKDVIILKARLQ